MAATLNATSRARAVRRVLFVILLANWAVAALKLFVGIWASFAAVTADGLHSFIDGSSNIIGLVAMSVAARPADANHPYGHGKFESLASLAIGAMVGVGMLELGRMAFHSLVNDVHPTVTPEMAIVMVATLVVNIGVTSVERWYGKKLKSSLLIADARHTLSDVFVTSAVLMSILFVWLGFAWADGVVALIVMGFVAVVAYRIVRGAVLILSDEARLEPKLVAEVTSQIRGVRSVRGIRSRGTEDSVYVDLIIEVDPALTTAHAHQVADGVERAIGQRFPQVVDVVVHVEPARA